MSQRLVGKNKSRKAKSLYAIQENQLVIQQDIPKLPVPIQKLYPVSNNFYQQIQYKQTNIFQMRWSYVIWQETSRKVNVLTRNAYALKD
jgi:hypothetical protein